jgi:hypothetical protein
MAIFVAHKGRRFYESPLLVKSGAAGTLVFVRRRTAQT